jgi:hypothetical protein
VRDQRVRLRPHPAVTTTRPNAAGLVGLDWSPPHNADRLDLQSTAGLDLASLQARPATVLVTVSGSSVELPRDTTPVAVLADHGILEVCTGTAVLAVSLPTDEPPLPQPTHSTIPWWPGQDPPQHDK